MNNLDEFKIEQPSLVQALDKYREMEKVLEEEYDSLRDTIIQSSNEWQGAASETLISEMEYFLNEGDYNTAYENVKTMRMCMEDTLEQVNALLAISEEFPKQLQSSTYIEPMRPAMGDNTIRNGGVVYLDYGKARLIPDLCEQVYEAAEYLGNVLKQHMESCNGIMDGIPAYISRVDEAVKKVKRMENYKFSFQKYVQGVMALENDVAVRLAGMKTVESIIGENNEIKRTLDREVGEKNSTEYGKEILDNYLIQLGYDSSIERKIIIYFIEQEYTHYLAMLYGTKYNSTSAYEEVKTQISLICARYKEEISFSYIKDFYKYNQDIFNYQLYVEYLDYLKSEQYICPAEYDDKLAMLETYNTIEGFDDFLEERENLFDELAVKTIINGESLPGWERVEVITALQIEAELLELGYDKEFICAIIGNMKTESGKCTRLEGLMNTEDDYGIHVIGCFNYLEKYNPYNVTQVNLVELYFDRQICHKPEENTNEDLHKWGIGMFQWTDQTRTNALFEEYFGIFGITVDNDNYKLTINNEEIAEDNMMDVSPIYLTFEQALDAEINHMLAEPEFQIALTKYNEMVSSVDIKENIRNAGDVVRLYYVKYYGTDTIGERQENGVRWYEARLQSWTN